MYTYIYIYVYTYIYIYVAGGNQAQHWHVDPMGKCSVPKPLVLAPTFGQSRTARPPAFLCA